MRGFTSAIRTLSEFVRHVGVHIKNGKSKVNFSIWDTYTPAQQVRLKNESAELIEKKWMPILTYKITHADARLTEAQRLMLIDWLKE